MAKIKKHSIAKIFYMIMIGVFLINSTANGIELSNKIYLRVPVESEATYFRMAEVLTRDVSDMQYENYYSRLYDELIQGLRKRSGEIIESPENYITRIKAAIAGKKKKGKVLIVAIDGNSGAFKTTSARDLGKAIELSGGKAVVIERDWFIGSRTQRREMFDDELRGVDVSLRDNEMALRSDKFEREVLKPLQDFNNGNEQKMTLSLSNLYNKDDGGLTRSESFKIDRKTIVIIEGNFLLNEKWNEYFDFKIVVLVKPSIGIERRLVRDSYAEEERIKKIFWRINTPSYIDYLQQHIIKPDLLIITDTWDEGRSVPLQKIAASCI